MDHQEILDFAIHLAHRGGAIIRDAFNGQGLSVDAVAKQGNPSDLVTEVDQHVERTVRALIAERYPAHRILGEEDGMADGQTTGWTLANDRHVPTWIVDPIDGTTNFAQRFPFTAISIAVSDAEGNLCVGVVYNPILNELYSARVDGGAWLNQTTRLPFPHGPEAAARAPRSLGECLIGFEHGSDRSPAVLDSRLASHRRLLARSAGDNGEGQVHGAQVRGVRCIGAGSLDMCLVARGAYDMYWEIGSHLWDIAAGTVILREAGGAMLSGCGLYGRPEINTAKELVTEAAFDPLGRKYLAVRGAADHPALDPGSGKAAMISLARELLTHLEDIEVTQDGVSDA
ncbi:hypothetical protein IWQ60_008504 [Tieghemiomyces parasiticus]|uniref:Inositol-1-monophosphatase n=1 Tax=Tieghemiomyces parasiticus TaxID=78921 RepID=A0A9W7ZRQ6_9FUNG|nr:hypothetical protein IWQ60_008504 [Tieghemiomyces parasiticus]